MTENVRAYHRRRCEPTVRRIWQAAQGGKISHSVLAKMFNQQGQTLERRLATYRRYGYQLPEVTSDKSERKRPTIRRPPKAAYALPDRLDPDGCQALAATLLTAAIEDVRAGRDVAQAVAFLWSDRAALFFDSVGVDRVAAMDALEGHLCD